MTLMRFCIAWWVDRMLIQGTSKEIAWIIDAIANGSDCDACPIQRLCSTVYAIDARKGIPLSDCKEIIAKYTNLIEE